MSSTALEHIFHQRMEVCINKVASERGNKRLKAWMWSEFAIGQRKRLEDEKAQAKERMEKEMKGASEHAEKEGWLWKDQKNFTPQWESGLKFIDQQWSAGIEGSHSALKNAVSELDRLVIHGARKRYELDNKEETRFTLVEQVSQRFRHWYYLRKNERLEMDATIQRISDADGEHPDDAYQYPEPYNLATARFVTLYGRESFAKVWSATTYDAYNVDNLDFICEVIKMSTTRSVIDVDPDLVDSIPENDHLLYLSSNGGNEPAFIQRNRDRWWDQQASNSSTFYFSPYGVDEDGPGSSVCSKDGTIAHIFIFPKTPSRVRLRLLHRRVGAMSVSIQEDRTELRLISSNEIPEELKLQDFELDQFMPGRHELELVVTKTSIVGAYFLRDIFVEFLDNPPSNSSGDEDDSISETTEEHKDAEAETSGTEDGNVEEGQIANSLSFVEIARPSED
ncbi:hypothetical protein GALMADRAFT_145807 [Galerina marginata CBS 339.88]|uniref:Uncharacterized protein n=1 Tax=Galerina marginata (strain CBS 339.88) TaxID=685588 RepID=A0A067SDS4_GALM3|nr:hypothetical protein GALMADRAFT_145807 [Galerina marginata CBS 339.88]